MRRPWIIILGSLALLVSCGKKSGETVTPLPTIPVKTVVAELGTIEAEREFAGGLEGIKQADIIVRIPEAVTELPFRIGERVNAGDVIVFLDKGGASSQYFQARATFENAEKNFKKMKYLYDEKAISESNFDAAESQFEVARANFRAARELVELTSPISGMLVELNPKVGDVPQAGTIAARVASIESLRMSFGVPADLAALFHDGMEGTLRVAKDDSVYACKVTRISSAADPQTRTFTIEVTVPNPAGRLQPGTFAKARFAIASATKALRVPQEALISEEGIHTLYIVKNDTARVRTVTVGIYNETTVEILSGVVPGDEVVCLGQGFLSDGYPVVRNKN